MRTVVGVALFVGISLPYSLVAMDVRAQATPAPVSTADSSAPSMSGDTTPIAVPSDLTQARPGGITADQVGERAAATSWTAKANEETLRGAAALVDQSLASFLPRLSGTAKYTRLSGFTPPSIAILTPAEVADLGIMGPGGKALSQGFSFPLVLNNWLFQASINVPISDYLVRLDQAYTAATRSVDAARWDVVSARAASNANGRIAYYTWLRARGGIIVTVQALNDQKTHLRDARNQFTVGNASKADVLRAETAAASAEYALEQAKNLADLSEKQLRVAIHVPDETPLAPGEDLDAPVQPVQGNVQALTVEALAARPEIKSADANAESIRKQADIARAGRWPNLSAFGDAIYANPNARYFPPPIPSKFFPTWDLGAQLIWSPNDILINGASAANMDAHAADIEANKNVVRDSIDVEVTQMLESVRLADFGVESSTRELASADEAYRVARELFINGRGTSTTLTDAETDLTRARLDLLNSKADARIARIRLEHALGRDAKPAAR
jgi:outer membrane protein TolC